MQIHFIVCESNSKDPHDHQSNNNHLTQRMKVQQGQHMSVWCSEHQAELEPPKNQNRTTQSAKPETGMAPAEPCFGNVDLGMSLAIRALSQRGTLNITKSSQCNPEPLPGLLRVTNPGEIFIPSLQWHPGNGSTAETAECSSLKSKPGKDLSHALVLHLGKNRNRVISTSLKTP